MGPQDILEIPYDEASCTYTYRRHRAGTRANPTARAFDVAVTDTGAHQCVAEEAYEVIRVVLDNSPRTSR